MTPERAYQIGLDVLSEAVNVSNSDRTEALEVLMEHNRKMEKHFAQMRRAEERIRLLEDCLKQWWLFADDNCWCNCYDEYGEKLKHDHGMCDACFAQQRAADVLEI